MISASSGGLPNSSLAVSSGWARASPKVVTCGISRHERVIRSAMVLRTALIGARRTGRDSPALRTSSSVILPPGPVPSTVARSTPSSFASLRTIGNAWARDGGAAGGASSSDPTIGSGAAPDGRSGSSPQVSPGSPMTASNASTSIVVPSPAPWCRRVPANGEGISTTALSVSISTRGSSSATASPTATCQETTTASVSPSPMSGRWNWFAMLRLHHAMHRGHDPADRRNVVLLRSAKRDHGVPPGYTLHRGQQ